jgi:acyl-CoA thioester hydrolase
VIDPGPPLTADLDGAIRDGRHIMQIRVYYEDTDFPVLVISAHESPCAAMTSSVVL